MLNISLDDDIVVNTTTPLPEKKEVRTFKTAGRGRKQCDGCGVFIGVRTKKCICGKEFLRKKIVSSPPSVRSNTRRGAEPKTKKEDVAPEPKRRIVYHIPDDVDVDPTRLYVVTAPAGKCPYELEATDADSLKVWMEKVRRHGIKRGNYYTMSSIKYYARYFYDYFSDEYKLVCKNLDEIEPSVE